MIRPIEYHVPATCWDRWCGSFDPVPRLDWQTPCLPWDDAMTPKADRPVRFDYQNGGPLYPLASWIARP